MMMRRLNREQQSAWLNRDHETTTPLELGKARSDRQETKAQRRGSRGDKERIKIQQSRVPGQLLQPGKGDIGKASADVREGRGH